jgi:chromosome partitioning protein
LPTLLLDADAISQSAYDWFKVAQADDFEIPANLVVERYPFDRTSLPGRAKDQLLEPGEGEGIGPDRDEPFPLAETTVHLWVHYMEAFGEIPTELSEYANLMKELIQA